MPDTTIRVEGADEIRAALRQLEDTGLTSQLRATNRNAAEKVVKRALPKVPTRTGRLKRSVKALATQRGGRVKAGSAAVPYAAAIHWGRTFGNVWHHKRARNPIRGRPFLYDAAKEARPEIIDSYQSDISALVAKAVEGR